MSLLRPCRDIAATDLCVGVSAVSIQSGDGTAVLKTPAAMRPILRPLHVIARGNHRSVGLFGEDDDAPYGGWPAEAADGQGCRFHSRRLPRGFAARSKAASSTRDAPRPTVDGL